MDLNFDVSNCFIGHSPLFRFFTFCSDVDFNLDALVEKGFLVIFANFVQTSEAVSGLVTPGPSPSEASSDMGTSPLRRPSTSPKPTGNSEENNGESPDWRPLRSRSFLTDAQV